MKKMFCALFVGLCLLWAGAAGAEVLRASPDGMSLTEALALAKDGDRIELADGVYTQPAEAFPLTVQRAVTICAAQEARPVIDAPAFLAAFRVEADGVTFRGLDVRMRRTGFYALGDDMTVEDCAISLADPEWRTSSCGIWMGGIHRAAVRGCAFTGCSIAMAGPPLSETSHLVPVLTGLFEVGEDVDFFTSHTISDCTVNGKPLFYAVNEERVLAPPDAGQVIIANCAEVVVEDADVSCASMGMEIAYCGHVQVTRCRADDCGVFGIYLAKNQGGDVIDSSCEGTNHGIDIRASQEINVIGCRANACDQGIFFSKVERGLVKDCTVTATGQGYFFAAGSHSQIDGCEAIDCENGLNIQKEDDMLITRCTLRGNSICAARLDGSPTVFSGNTLEDNWVGIMAYGEVPFMIVDNEVKNSGSCGLYLRDIAYSRISGNTIAESRKSSMQAVGEMAGTLFTGNRLDRACELSKGAALRGLNSPAER